MWTTFIQPRNEIFCAHSNELSRSMTCRAFIDQLRNCALLKNNCVSCCYFITVISKQYISMSVCMQVVLNTMMDHLLEKVPTHLPDIVLLNLLLQCKALLDLQKYMNMHLTMSQLKYYHGKYTMHFLFVSVHLFTKFLV